MKEQELIFHKFVLNNEVNELNDKIINIETDENLLYIIPQKLKINDNFDAFRLFFRVKKPFSNLPGIEYGKMRNLLLKLPSNIWSCC